MKKVINILSFDGLPIAFKTLVVEKAVNDLIALGFSFSSASIAKSQKDGWNFIYVNFHDSMPGSEKILAWGAVRENAESAVKNNTGRIFEASKNGEYESFMDTARSFIKSHNKVKIKIRGVNCEVWANGTVEMDPKELLQIVLAEAKEYAEGM